MTKFIQRLTIQKTKEPGKFTKEKIVSLYNVLLYTAGYEKDIVSGDDIEAAVDDLIYLRNEIIRLHNENELSDGEMADLMRFVNTIVTHITNGNKNEERLVNVMGGRIIETQTEKWIRQGMEQGMRQGEAKMIVELGQEDGLGDKAILNRLQKKIGVSYEEAAAYLAEYSKQFV